MQRYWWPGYEMQLLGELQRQQNSAEFCDTLLQTEGISVPTHSCVLAALSPYLFQKLSTSPSPPCGQKRRLQLQSVKAHTLLKVVGLLYSGKLEVTGSLQQSDVLAVARQFGIADLAEGQKDGMAKEGQLQEKRQRAGSCSDTGFYGSERGESRKMWDAQVQAELAGERETYSPAENRRYVSTGTQTVKAVEKSVESFVNFFGQTTHSAPESVPSVAPNLDFSAMWEPQIITLDKQLCFTSGPVIPSMPNGATNDGESTSGQSSGSVINPKSIPALSNNMTAFPVPLTGDSNPFTSLRSYGCGDSTQVLAEKATGLENGNPNDEMADRRENREQPSHASRDETVGEERGRCAEVVHAPASEGVRGPSLVKQMQQMVETTHISIKVKLRRRTKGETWEVVSMQDPDETEPFAFQRQDGSNHREPQTDLMPTTQPPPSAVDVSVVCKPDAPILLPATTGTPKLPPQSSPSSDSQPPSSDCFTPNQNDGVEAALLPQPQDSVEESDEQLEKLLEDIMIGLNILPNLERDCKASLHPQPSHDRVESSCQVLDSQNEAEDSQMHTAVSAAVCALCQDLGTQSQQSSANTGSPCCFTAHNQPDSSLFVQPSAVLLQQQQCSAQYHSSVMSMGHRDGLSQQSMPLTKSQEHLQPEEPTTRPALPSALFSAGQKLHYPAFQESSSQDNQHAFEFVPLITGNETQSLHTVFLPCMDDLGLPRCLSPLGPCTSATKHHAALNNPANLGYKIQQQPSPHVQPWLTENPGSLQFPLSAITHRKNASVSLSQDTKCSCWTQRCQEHLAPNPQNGGTWTESCAVKKVKRGTTICAGQQNGKGLEYDPRKMKESLKCKEGDMIGDAIAPKKRRHPSHSQHAANYPIAYKNVKVSDGTMGQMNLSVCSVSLSSNNVLVNEREMATRFSSVPAVYVGKPAQPSSITRRLRDSQVNSDYTRNRTRGFLKRSHESSSDTSPEKSLVPKSLARKVKMVNKEVVLPKQKCGRLQKRKHEECAPKNPAVAENESHNGEGPQINKDLPKEDSDKGDKAKIRCIKRRGNRSTEVKTIPLKTIITESTGKSDTNNNDISPALRSIGTRRRPQMITLKGSQKLIGLHHCKTRKSKENLETKGTVRDAESEGAASRESTFQESTGEMTTVTHIAHPQDGDGGVESPIVVSVLVDENHSHIYNKEEETTRQNDTVSSTSETILFGGEPVLSFEDVTKLAAETEQPLKSSAEGKTCDAGVLNTAKQTDVKKTGLSHNDTHPQENKLVSDHNFCPQIPERTGPPLWETGGISGTPGCGQEADEEVEVDVLLCSPDMIAETEECEHGHNLKINLDNEEEEDMSEIDVTGDDGIVLYHVV